MKRDRKVISNSRRLKRLPNINQLRIDRIQKEGDENVQDFLLNVAPHKLEGFAFGGDMNILNVTFYLEGLHAVLKSTTIYMVFSYCIRD